MRCNNLGQVLMRRIPEPERFGSEVMNKNNGHNVANSIGNTKIGRMAFHDNTSNATNALTIA